MNRRKPGKGEVYRHFRGKLYRILHIAVWTENGGEMVVFRPNDDTNEEGKVYVSLLEQFLSPVDKEKYPDADQEYRFELVREDAQEKTKRPDRERAEGKSPEELILAFLDLKDNEERIEFLQKHRSEMSDRFLTAASESLEFVENAETMEERYAGLLRFLRTKVKYESRRLR
ncbi:MAG TPA: DUF1653 domain-containing protein [Candidatus Mediterraneibacter cottocaccae]|nr:DUF1653 domain-containing protein [Candidatus Mediterraneibacter cottocaccae]